MGDKINLDIGMKLDLIKTKKDKKITYASQLLDFIDPDEIVVSGPIEKGQLVLIHKGDKLDICYYLEDKGRYCFTVEVLSRNYSRIYTLRLKKISDTRKIQLRRYFRLPTSLHVTKNFQPQSSLELLTEECAAKDISGGGMRLLCNYEHDLGDEFDCSFTINNNIINVKAEVVRVQENNTDDYKYALGIYFKFIQEFNRDEIIKYIFDQQRILRIKGLI